MKRFCSGLSHNLSANSQAPTSAREADIKTRARSNTSATLIAVMQRWSMGQSRNMHGAQSGGRRIISPLGPNGRVVAGFVGPNITSVGVPTALPMCAGPVSFVTSTLATLISAVTSPTVVTPVKRVG